MSLSARAGAFEGDLKALSVVELVQTVSLGSKTGRVLVSSDTRRGEMWFQDGVMTHAAAGSVFGDLAVYAMIEWTSGRFLVEYGLTSEARSITQDATYLVLEGLRRFDERSANGSSPADPGEVVPLLKADARRNDSRRFALGLVAIGIAVGAIGTTALRDRPSPSATDAVAAVVAPEASVAHKVPPRRPPAKRSASFRPPPKREAIVAASPAPVPAVALPDPQVTSGDAPVTLSAADGGSLTALVDGTPTSTHEHLAKREPF